MKEKKFKVGDRVIGIGSYDGKNIDGLKGRILDEIPNCHGEYPVEFDKDIDGHDCARRGKYGYCWWVREDHLKLAANETIVIYRKDNDVIALNKATGERGFARCNPSDTFDFATGAKLAFERLMGIDKVKEVKRHATVGEYIKIVKADGSPCNEYRNGDILKVIKVLDGRAYYADIFAKFAFPSEYVVLEGYKPDETNVEEVKPYNGKIIFTKCDADFTPHKIYEIVDGKITNDYGKVLPNLSAFKTIDDVKNYFGDKSTGGFCGKWYNRHNPSEFIEVVE